MADFDLKRWCQSITQVNLVSTMLIILKSNNVLQFRAKERLNILLDKP